MHNDGHAILRSAAWRLLILAACLLSSGLLCATFVRFAPGFDADERELDWRLSSDSITAIRRAHQDQQNVLHFYATYLRRSLQGDFGTSNLFQQPISQLMRDRWSITAANIGWGLALAWPRTRER